MNANVSHPVVLAIGGHDPSGGAGIVADALTLAHFGCVPATVTTCLTVQDSLDLSELNPVAPEIVIAQAQAVLADMPVAAIKIGALADAAIADGLRPLIESQRVPVVLDPVLAAGGGMAMADAELLEAIQRLLPHVDLLTPNRMEAELLRLNRALGPAVLITDGDTGGVEIENRLITANGEQVWRWRKRAGVFRGTGCRLSSAIAAGLAHGLELASAIAEAQAYVDDALATARMPGRGQALPWGRVWLTED